MFPFPGILCKYELQGYMYYCVSHDASVRRQTEEVKALEGEKKGLIMNFFV